MNSTIIKMECSEFLKASDLKPLIRVLPKQGSDYRKVKVRKRNKNTDFDRLFNSVFSKYPDIRARCVFGNTKVDFIPEDKEEFYIFPIDGFKYIFSYQVQNSTEQYREAFDALMSTLITEEAVTEAFTDLLRYNYQSKDLKYALASDCEIIVYNIPYFYAVRKSSVINYSTLFSL
jgi:hypothetical protein